MERRNFIKHSALMGIALAAVPSVAFGHWKALPSSRLQAPRFLHNVLPNEQVRHGLMQLPQRDLLGPNEALNFNSLHSVQRHILLKDAGTKADSEAVMDIVSLSFHDALQDDFSATQIQLTAEGWMVVTRDEIITIPHANVANGMQEIVTLNSPSNAQLWLGKIDPGKGFQLDEKQDRYVLMLEGAANLNGSEVQENAGVRLDDSALELRANFGATVLMLSFS